MLQNLPKRWCTVVTHPCKVVAPSNVLSACHVTFKETVTELHLPPDFTTVEPPEVAALAAEPPEVSVVSSSESLSCPVTAMEASGNSHLVLSRLGRLSVSSHPVLSRLGRPSVSSHPVLSRLGRPSVNSHPVLSRLWRPSVSSHPAKSRLWRPPVISPSCPVMATKTAEDFLSSLATPLTP